MVEVLNKRIVGHGVVVWRRLGWVRKIDINKCREVQFECSVAAKESLWENESCKGLEDNCLHLIVKEQL